METDYGSRKNVLALFRLDGRRALVTGGNRGLGRVIAEALAQAGADVAIVSRTLSDCRATAEELAASTARRVVGIAADVSQSSDVERLAAAVEIELGQVDILVNSAGLNVRGAAEELSESDWDAVISTNLKAPFLCGRVFGPRMCRRGRG